jgi:hypothetical protein
VSKFPDRLRKVFYTLTGQRRVRKLEERLKRLEHDHYALLARFTVTVSYYEQRIDTLINSVALTLAQEGRIETLRPNDENILEFGRRPDVSDHRP